GVLLGDQRGLPLWKDDDARHQLNVASQRREVAEQHEYLVEHMPGVITPTPAARSIGICAKDVIVDEDVVEAHLFDGLRMAADIRRIAADFGLWEDCANFHRYACRPNKLSVN